MSIKDIHCSLRTVLGVIIGSMGLLGIILSLMSGAVHQQLTVENQRTAMNEMVRLKVDDLLKGLEQKSHDLGVALQGMPQFRAAYAKQDTESVTDLLNNQFHQYFVTAGIIKLSRLIVFDQNFIITHESTEAVSEPWRGLGICPLLFERGRQRTGRQRMKVMADLCHIGSTPYYVVIIPIGGLHLKGYMGIFADPSHSLLPIEESLGMPIKIGLSNGAVVSQSEDWPDGQGAKNSFVTEYTLRALDSTPVISVKIAQDISSLSQSLYRARLGMMLIAVIATLGVALFSLWLVHGTTLKPLRQLRDKLHSLHEDRTHMGQQLEVIGNKEIRELTLGFNKTSRELDELYQALENMAYTDSLTKLPNRHLFHERLQEFTEHYKTTKTSFALALLDLDRFKAVNDTLGHHIGDQLLQEVSTRLHQVIRGNDIVSKLDQETINKLEGNMVARLGGDEFAGIFPGIDCAENAIVIAEKLLSAIKSPFFVGEHRFTIGTSIGVVLCPAHGDDLYTLIRHADVAMYHAKNNNLGFSLYDSTMDKNGLRQLQLEQDLLSAIKHEELELHYQPKINLQSGIICGTEVLVRWQHPKSGMIMPNEFIPLAEQTGMIHEVTQWVLDKALESCASWQSEGVASGVSVNLSTLDLHDQDIMDSISQKLSKWEVPPESLILEITESAIMSNPVQVVANLSALDKMGITLSIDDFGTGYSSFSYIKNLPVDEIKVDKSFIKELCRNEKDEAIVRSILVLAHNMKMTMVAEGVEDEQTLGYLAELGCDIAQGYFIAKPMPFADYLTWMKNYTIPSVLNVPV